MNRNDFRVLCRIRLKDARTLLANRNYDGAYYISDYIIEFGLKAVIAKKTMQHDFPDKNFAKNVHVHDLRALIGLAGLSLDFDKNIKNDSIFENNWVVVKDWKEGSRYMRHAEKKAKDMYTAITDKKHGILVWIKRYW